MVHSVGCERCAEENDSLHIHICVCCLQKVMFKASWKLSLKAWIFRCRLMTKLFLVSEGTKKFMFDVSFLFLTFHKYLLRDSELKDILTLIKLLGKQKFQKMHKQLLRTLPKKGEKESRNVFGAVTLQSYTFKEGNRRYGPEIRSKNSCWNFPLSFTVDDVFTKLSLLRLKGYGILY